MTFAEMKTELAARGFAHLDTRVGQIVNDAIEEFEGLYRWPFLEDSAQGVAPLSIPTLGTIEAVVNETNSSSGPLEPRSYQWLLDNVTDLGETGTPMFFYVAWPAGDPVVCTWPTSTDTIGCQFWAVSTALSADGDEPLTPARYHAAILQIAQRMAESERGNLNAATGLQNEIDRKLNRLVDSLLGGQQNFGPDLTRTTGASEDW